MNFTGKVLIYYFSLKLIYMLISSYRVRCIQLKKDALTISYTIEPDSTDVKAFSDFYNSFARAKGIESCKDKKLIALMESKQLIIMSVYQKNGLMLASSAIIANNKTAIGLYTAS